MMDNFHIEKLKRAIKKRVYIFIDAANLERSVQDIKVNEKDAKEIGVNNDEVIWRVDYKQFKDFFESICDCRMVKFYSVNFQTRSHINFLTFLKRVLHIAMETKPLKEYEDHTEECPHRKANFDVEIAVDATFEMDNYETLILFSGDCDFEYLIKFLRKHNKNVIVFSRSGHVAKELPLASSYYFDIIYFRNDLLKISKSKRPRQEGGIRS